MSFTAYYELMRLPEAAQAFTRLRPPFPSRSSGGISAVRGHHRALGALVLLLAAAPNALVRGNGLVMKPTFPYSSGDRFRHRYLKAFI
jgi:hypothetical protein